MKAGDDLPVAVLGGGLAGLVAARELHRNGFNVRVFESSDVIAGLSGTHRDDDGFTYDIGAHFITNRLAAAVGVSGSCLPVRRYGETVRISGRYVDYPLGLMTQPRFVLSALGGRLRCSKPPVTAAERFRREYGDALARDVAIPLVEAWSGVPATLLAASVADKIPAGLLHTIALNRMSKATGRAISVGYCSTKPMSASVFHVYPENGVATVCQRLADQLPDGSVELNSPIDAIVVDQQQVRAVRVRGVEHEVRAVVSTAPVNVLPRLVQGSDALEPYRRFRYRPMVLVNLKLEGRDLLNDVVVWTPNGFPFFRLTEATQSMPWLAPDGKTMVLCDIGAQIGDDHWSMGDDELGKYCVEHLRPLIPDVDRRYLGARVSRTPIAYPVYLQEYESDRLALRDSTGVGGLISVGRHGEFSHNLMEDVYWLTIDKVHRWIDSLPGA